LGRISGRAGAAEKDGAATEAVCVEFITDDRGGRA
jgi:hypothetical protein